MLNCVCLIVYDKSNNYKQNKTKQKISLNDGSCHFTHVQTDTGSSYLGNVKR